MKFDRVILWLAGLDTSLSEYFSKRLGIEFKKSKNRRSLLIDLANLGDKNTILLKEDLTFDRKAMHAGYRSSSKRRTLTSLFST